MKMSKLYLATLKEVPAEAELISHQLMLRAGLMRNLTAGVYSFLPLGYKVIKKVEKIIREVMDKSGAQEVLLPVMHTADLWQETGRWDKFGPLMIKFKDRKDREYCLGPTHEEVVTALIRDEVRSYKDLPFNLYQIQTKVRDEIRPRFGLMRAREFIMKDAYSFDCDFQGLDESYQTMYNAYQESFARCGLEVRAVEADTGAMGGKDSHEFMVLAEAGEDEIAFCSQCDYAANLERARAFFQINDKKEELKDIEKIETPAKKTIKEVSQFLNIEETKMIKTLGLLADGKPILVLLQGEDQLNEVKLKNQLNVDELLVVDDTDFPQTFNSIAGFIGPYGLDKIKIYADQRVKEIKNGVTGANEKDYHYLNVNPQRDFKVEGYYDLRTVKSKDKCPHCQGDLEIKSGIEVGHIFKLGTKYSESLEAKYLDQNGKEQLIVMGSYGIGITRLVAAAIEQNHDQAGIIWPKSIAPYQVIILPLGKGEVEKAAEELYQELLAQQVEVLLDDRKKRAGVKFNDAELIGIPLRITIGSRSLEKAIVEVKERKTQKEYEFPLKDAVQRVIDLLETME